MQIIRGENDETTPCILSNEGYLITEVVIETIQPFKFGVGTLEKHKAVSRIHVVETIQNLLSN